MALHRAHLADTHPIPPAPTPPTQVHPHHRLRFRWDFDLCLHLTCHLHPLLPPHPSNLITSLPLPTTLLHQMVRQASTMGLSLLHLLASEAYRWVEACLRRAHHLSALVALLPTHRQGCHLLHPVSRLAKAAQDRKRDGFVKDAVCSIDPLLNHRTFDRGHNRSRWPQRSYSLPSISSWVVSHNTFVSQSAMGWGNLSGWKGYKG